MPSLRASLIRMTESDVWRVLQRRYQRYVLLGGCILGALLLAALAPWVIDVARGKASLPETLGRVWPTLLLLVFCGGSLLMFWRRRARDPASGDAHPARVLRTEDGGRVVVVQPEEGRVLTWRVRQSSLEPGQEVWLVAWYQDGMGDVSQPQVRGRITRGDTLTIVAEGSDGNPVVLAPRSPSWTLPAQ